MYRKFSRESYMAGRIERISMLAVVGGILCSAGQRTALPAELHKLFPTNLTTSEWVQFEAAGFEKPVSGVIYQLPQPAANGMPLGGSDTGCLDLETSGLLGYCTIFNTHVPRRGPLNLPFLGISVDGTTWVL